MVRIRIGGEGEEEVHIWVVRVSDGLFRFIGGVEAANLSFS